MSGSVWAWKPLPCPKERYKDTEWFDIILLPQSRGRGPSEGPSGGCLIGLTAIVVRVVVYCICAVQEELLGVLEFSAILTECRGILVNFE